MRMKATSRERGVATSVIAIIIAVAVVAPLVTLIKSGGLQETKPVMKIFASPENLPPENENNIITYLSIYPSSFTLQSGQESAIILTANLRAAIAEYENNFPLAGETITWEASWGSIYPENGTTDNLGQVTAAYTAPITTILVWDTIVATFWGSGQYQLSFGTASAQILPENYYILPENIPPENLPPENLPPENILFWVWVDSLTENLQYTFYLSGNEEPWMLSPENELIHPEENIGDAIVNAIVLTMATNVDDAILIVAYTDKPPGIQAPTGIVYDYLEISTNAEGSISSAKVEFKVLKSWVDANGIDKETITLRRYHSGWQTLPTSITGEDEQYFYCSAETSGFSLFSITGEKAASFPLLAVVAAVLVVLGILVAAVWFYTREARGDAASILAERGLSDMRLVEVDVFNVIRSRKEFTISDLMRETRVSKTLARRTIQKLVRKGLVRPTNHFKPAAGGLGGRGKPSKVYKYVGK